MSSVGALDPAERERSLANLKLEQDAIVLYDRLAGIEKDPRRAAAFQTIAGNERRHAQVWAGRLREMGVDVPPTGSPRLRVRFIIGVARVFGTRAVSDMVKSLEGDEGELYESQDDPDVAAIMADEQEHAEIWQRLDAGLPGVAAAPGTEAAAATQAAAPERAREESWHHAGSTGTFRASVFGINDGLVSNLALVMGIAGASADNHFIVLAGIAGLLAGSFSMAAGEYISMQSQRELFERQIVLEREEMKIMPESEERELAAIYRAKGLDPAQLGSPWGAAAYSFAAFALGAFLPLAPFLVTSGLPAIAGSIVIALTSLFVVGVLVSLLTGKSAVFSGLRQVTIGGAAAAVTFAVGSLIGVQVG